MPAPKSLTQALATLVRTLLAATCPQRVPRRILVDLTIEFWDDEPPFRLHLPIPLPLETEPPPAAKPK